MRAIVNTLFVSLWGLLFGFDVYWLHLEVINHAYVAAVIYGALTLFAGYVLVSRIRVAIS